MYLPCFNLGQDFPFFYTFTTNEINANLSIHLLPDFSDGFTYERKSIENWLRKDRLPLSPMTNKVLANKSLVPNQTLKSMIVQHLDRAAAASSISAEMTEEPVE